MKKEKRKANFVKISIKIENKILKCFVKKCKSKAKFEKKIINFEKKISKCFVKKCKKTKKNDRKKKILSNKLNRIFKKRIRSLKPKKVEMRKSARIIRVQKIKKEMERRAKFDAQMLEFDKKIL